MTNGKSQVYGSERRTENDWFFSKLLDVKPSEDILVTSLNEK